MHKEVTRHPGAVVLIVSPPKHSFSVERSLWGRPKELHPVDGVRRSVRGNGVLPSADGRIAVPPSFDHIQLAKLTAFIDLLSVLVENGADTLASHLEYLARAALSLDQGCSFFYSLDHWLLNINILSGFHRFNGNLTVPVVGSANNDRIDILPGQEFPIVPGSFKVRSESFLYMDKPPVIDISGCHQLDTWGPQGRLSVALSLPTCANQCNLNTVVRGHLISRSSDARGA
ncbi:uncharacterized protein METZ01_LOCUS133066 [marine metagenome]|uniref:Uncharacterized protein n=1 Tax=marine metagenome TaxID=408172 RepID=A0A381YUB7_9ZZZZ